MLRSAGQQVMRGKQNTFGDSELPASSEEVLHVLLSTCALEMIVWPARWLNDGASKLRINGVHQSAVSETEAREKGSNERSTRKRAAAQRITKEKGRYLSSFLSHSSNCVNAHISHSSTQSSNYLHKIQPSESTERRVFSLI